MKRKHAGKRKKKKKTLINANKINAGESEHLAK